MACLVGLLLFTAGYALGVHLEGSRWRRAAGRWPRWLWCGERLFWVREHPNCEEDNALW